MKYCATCGSDYEDVLAACPNCTGSASMPMNWREWIAQVEREYEEIYGSDYLAIGLQKDAIQNSWGARISPKGANWSFGFEFIQDKDKGSFLIATDQMCYGLTGPDTPPDQLKNIQDNKDYRLAKFRSMLYSADNLQGAGQFGRGKTLYLAASKDHHIIYDSYTNKGEYRSGWIKIVGDDLKLSNNFTDNAARKNLEKHGPEGIKPLATYGTRIIIVNPRDELIEAIKDGRMTEYIGETWWLILMRNLEIATIYKGKKKKAEMPAEFVNLSSTDSSERKCRTYSAIFDYKGTSCRFKKVQLFFANKKITDSLRGVYLYRRDMKIAKMDLKEVPPEMDDKLYGYAELEPQSALEDIYNNQKVEGVEHGSFAKHKGIFQAMKNSLDDCFKQFKDEMGFGYYKGQEERKTKEASEKAYQSFQEEWGELSGLGTGQPLHPAKKLKIWLFSLELPRPPQKFVYAGDDLTNVIFKIKNISTADLALKITFKTIDENDKLIEELDSIDDVAIAVGKTWKNSAFGFRVDGAKYNMERFYLVCSCEDQAGQVKEEKKEIVYVGPPSSPIATKPVSLELQSIVFPKDRRADFGEKITNIEYHVKNETCAKIQAKFRLRVIEFPTSQQGQEIIICEKDMDINPNAEEHVICPDIEIQAEKFKKLFEGGEKGAVILRATLVNLKDFVFDLGNGATTCERADKLAICDTKFWVNCEAGKGIFDRLDCSWEGGLEEPKSRVDGSTFILNNTHPEFVIVKNSKDDERRENYIYEQYCRQALVLILRKGDSGKWPEHPKYKDYKKEIEKEKANKHELTTAVFNTLDSMLAKHYR
jgi:hypothetical protein